MNLIKLFFTLPLFIPLCLNAQLIEIKNYYSYHPSQLGTEYGVLEDGSIDESGLLYVFVKNLSLSDSIVEVKFKDGDGNYSDPYGWHAIPGRLDEEHDNYCGLTIKGGDQPLVSGEEVTVIVTTENGAKDSILISSLEKRQLQIANLIPSQDKETLYLYVRNDGVETLTLTSLNYNDNAYSIPSVSVEVPGGSADIEPKEILILKFAPAYLFEETDQALVSIEYNVAGGVDEYSTTAVRIVHPEFRLGSWHSSAYNFENEEGRKHLRRLGLQTFQGPGNYVLMSDGYDRYHFKTIREANFGDPFDPAMAYEEVETYKDSIMMDVWIIDDEPDLNGKDIESQLAKFNTYRRADSSTAIYINLAVQKKYQRYGFYADIVGMDHYSAPNAPNIIPLTWIPLVGRTGELKESLEYSDVLKFNTEPRRNWAWVQFATSTWDYQPDPQVFSYQFWAHIMGGAKSMKYFAANSNSIHEFNGNWNTALATYRRFKQVRNIVLYGEPNSLVQSDNEEVLVRSLIGEEYMAVVGLNNSIAFEGDILDGFETIYTPEDYVIDCWVPEWIDPEDIYRLTPFGKNYDFTYSWIADDSLRIISEIPIKTTSEVYVIGPMDDEPPYPLERLRFAQYFDVENYTFSWAEPYDNSGTKAYNVFFNNQFITQTIAPIYEVKNQGSACSGWWRFEPVDNSGNIGESDSLFMVFEGAPAMIMENPFDTTVFYGDSAKFNFETNHIGAFQWQCYDDETMTWSNLEESYDHEGVMTPTLIVVSATEEKKYRCVFINPCDGSQLVSDEADLIIFDDSGIIENEFIFSIFPNPTSGNFVVKHSADTPVEMSIFDLQGKRVFHDALNSEEYQVELDLTGVFLVRLTTGNAAYIKRLIIQ